MSPGRALKVLSERGVLTLDLDALRGAALIALVSLSSYALGFRFTSLFHDASAETGALWAVISGILALQATRRSTWAAALLRVSGTLIGASIATAYISTLPFSALGLAATTFVTVVLCHAARIADHARLAVFTVAVMMVLSNLHETLPPIVNGLLRLAESCIGAATAVIAVLVWPEPAEPPSPAAE